MKELNTLLTKEQASFAVMLEEKAPYLQHLWDFEKRAHKDDEIEIYFKTASHGESIMARFFLSVWRQDNFYNFDCIEAVKTLDSSSLTIVLDWMNEPFFP